MLSTIEATHQSADRLDEESMNILTKKHSNTSTYFFELCIIAPMVPVHKKSIPRKRRCSPRGAFVFKLMLNANIRDQCPAQLTNNAIVPESQKCKE